jgi:hypothetical protein
MTWLETCLAVKNSSHEEILTVILVQLNEKLRGYMEVLNMTIKIKKRINLELRCSL